MGEYEDRYPDAYGHGEVIDESAEHRHFSGLELPRQTRDPALPPEAQPGEPRTAPPAHHRERVTRPFVARRPEEIRDDVIQQLDDSPFIDAAGIGVTVEGSEVTLDGTINSLIAIALAQALCSNVAGVTRAQVHLRVKAAPRTYETAEPPVYKVSE